MDGHRTVDGTNGVYGPRYAVIDGRNRGVKMWIDGFGGAKRSFQVEAYVAAGSQLKHWRLSSASRYLLFDYSILLTALKFSSLRWSSVPFSSFQWLQQVFGGGKDSTHLFRPSF